jgi:hypothetical protein
MIRKSRIDAIVAVCAIVCGVTVGQSSAQEASPTLDVPPLKNDEASEPESGAEDGRGEGNSQDEGQDDGQGEDDGEGENDGQGEDHGQGENDGQGEDHGRDEDDWGEDESDWSEDSDGEDGWDSGAPKDEFDQLFSDIVLSDSAVDNGEAAPLPLSVGGFLRSTWGLWLERFDDNPFATARQSLDMWLRYRSNNFRVLVEGHLEYDLAYLYRRDDYESPTLDAYEWLIDARDAYVEYTKGRFAAKFGRQVLPLGQSNLITPLDVVSPYDFREPGVTDVEDMRLSLLATRVDVLFGSSQVSALIIHESGFGYRSPPRGPYGQLSALGETPEQRPLRYHDLQPRFALDQQEVVLQWSYRGPGIDVNLYAASVLDNQGVFILPQTPPPPEQDEVDIDLDHGRYIAVGHSGVYPWSDLVFKWDLGLAIGQPINVLPDGDLFALSVAETSLLNVVLSVDYFLSSNTVFTVEAGKGFYLDDTADVLLPYSAPTLALRASHRRWHDDLELSSTMLFSGLELEYGWLARGNVSYRFREGFRGILGYVSYHPGDQFSLLAGFDTHDRLYGQLRWDFQVL